MEPAAASSKPDTGIILSGSVQPHPGWGRGNKFPPSLIPPLSPSHLPGSFQCLDGSFGTLRNTTGDQTATTKYKYPQKTDLNWGKDLLFQVVSTYLGALSSCAPGLREQGEERTQREHHNKVNAFFFMYFLLVYMYVCYMCAWCAEIRRPWIP